MSPPLCRFFNGKPYSCRNGDSCPFLHSDPVVLRRFQYKDHSLPKFGNQGNMSEYYSGFRKPDPKYKYLAPKPEPISISGNEINHRKCSKEHMGTVITTGLHDAGIRTKSKHEKENCVDSTFNTNKISVDHVYSMRSDLSTDDVQAFEAEEFVLGHIPLIPPPKSMA